MSLVRLTRPNQTWALAYASAFVNPATPTAAELNNPLFVHLISCACTEDVTALSLADSEKDSTLTFCSIGNEVTLTLGNVKGVISWLKDANTGGSGSSPDLNSIFNKATSLLMAPDVSYWLISRTGPNASQDIPFAIGHKIKMALFNTDNQQDQLENKKPLRGIQNLVFQGSYNWNYTIAS